MLQVGTIAPPLRENGSAGTASPSAAIDREPESELLVASGSTKQKNGIFAKAVRLLKKLCSTHQFRNEQVSASFLLCGYVSTIYFNPVYRKFLCIKS